MPLAVLQGVHMIFCLKKYLRAHCKSTFLFNILFRIRNSKVIISFKMRTFEFLDVP